MMHVCGDETGEDASGSFVSYLFRSYFSGQSQSSDASRPDGRACWRAPC